MELTKIEPAEATLVEIHDRALETELALQFRFARENPRDLKRVIAAITQLSTLDADTSEEMIYSLPGRDREDPDKRVEGASIRFAEALAQCWGNNRTESRVVEIDRVNKQIVAEGVFHDLETNAITKMRCARSIATKQGEIYGAEMIKQTQNAACAIAKRNAILGGIPKGAWGAAQKEARATITAAFRRLTPAQLAGKRKEAIGYLGRKGVTPDQVYRRLGVKSEVEIQAQDLLDLRSLADALRNGLATKEELFEQGLALPTPDAAPKKRATLQSVAAADDEPEPAPAAAIQEKVVEAEPAPAPQTKAELFDKAFKDGAADYHTGIGLEVVPKEMRGKPGLIEARAKGWKDAEARDGCSDE